MRRHVSALVALPFAVSLIPGCCCCVPAPPRAPNQVAAPGPVQNHAGAADTEQRIAAKIAAVPKEEIDNPVKIQDFILDWRENRLFGDQRYRGRLVVLNGFVRRIDRSLGVAFAILDDGKPFTVDSVRCDFLKGEEPYLVPLVKEDGILVRGRCTGPFALRDCEVLMTSAIIREREARKAKD